MAKRKKSEAPGAESSGLKPMHIALIGLGVILVLVILTVLWGIATYNLLVGSQVNVDEKWANVQADYQRRIDLIPNLVSTVKASADFETNLQTQVTAMRAGVSTAKTPAEMEILGTKINSAINLVFENYPQIRSTENFLSLQDELAGTENRIKVSRTAFNEAVKTYNINVRTFPKSIIAGMFSFGQRTMFEAAAGADVAPNVGNLFGNTA